MCQLLNWFMCLVIIGHFCFLIFHYHKYNIMNPVYCRLLQLIMTMTTMLTFLEPKKRRRQLESMLPKWRVLARRKNVCYPTFFVFYWLIYSFRVFLLVYCVGSWLLSFLFFRHRTHLADLMCIYQFDAALLSYFHDGVVSRRVMDSLTQR